MAAGFSGFGRDMMPFFMELAAQQSRDWFLANKHRYTRDVATPLEQLMDSLTLALAARDVPLLGTRASIFRLNRDIRFSRDKAPYKTHASAVLTRTGTKKSLGLLYIHFGPDRSFTALGFHSLEPAPLSALRDAILDDQAGWRRVIAELAAAGLAISRENMTARLPRLYQAQAVGDLADWFRLKSLIVSRELPQEALFDPGLVDTIADFATAGLPLLRFGWRVLG
jgi:uncharacterized protein (TIGR02453 family)